MSVRAVRRPGKSDNRSTPLHTQCHYVPCVGVLVALDVVGG